MNTLVELYKSMPLGSKIGALVAVAAIAILSKLVMDRGVPPPAKRGPALNPSEYKKFKLREKIFINHNTRLYRFDLPNPDDIVGLPVGQHMSLKAHVEGKDIMRSYTPVSSDDERGYFDLLVKVYDKGLMSQYIDKLQPGDMIDIRGPKGKFTYKAGMMKHVSMLAGGTGITPMLQIIRAILKNPADTTQISLIFANVGADDILLKEELDGLMEKHPNFKVYYVLNNPPETWKGGVGFVSKEMIEEHFVGPNEDTKVLLCGPPMMLKAMQGHLATVGFNVDEQSVMF